MDNNFIPVRTKLRKQLDELEQKSKTPAEYRKYLRMDRQYRDWCCVEERLKHPLLGFDPRTQTPVQNLVMMAARTNAAYPFAEQ